MRPTQVEWAYLAGFLDGEGCIHGWRRHPHSKAKVHIRVSQRYGSLIDDLADHFGVGSVNNQGPGRLWVIASQSQVRHILHGVLPYLKLKQPQALVALQILEQNLGHDEDTRRMAVLSALKTEEAS